MTSLFRIPTDFFTLNLASISASQTRVQVYQMNTEAESRLETKDAFYFNESQKSCDSTRELDTNKNQYGLPSDRFYVA
ncbi:hypothetical protein J6590_054515 [Homalodisca vitripennis]|nr:hypothetical protein J6590_054515 [Homalodisca vitripennis]